MDLVVCGIVDIVLVVLLLIVCGAGFKKGFLKKAIGLVSLLVAVIVAFCFCSQLADFLQEKQIIFPTIYDNIYANISASEALANPNASVVEVLVSLDIPKFLAEMVSNALGEIDAHAIADKITTYLTETIMVVISFVAIFIGVFVAAFLLKIISSILRGNALVRFVDGVLGMAFYAGIYIVIIYGLFAVVGLCMEQEWFVVVKDFLVVDMKLGEDTFRISKFIYEHNIVLNIINTLF